MTARRTRRLDAPPARVWGVVADPWSLPRWWPRVERVEDVRSHAWTVVMVSERGRSVRADYRLAASDPPVRRRWAHELEGSPFERILASSEVEVSLQGDAGGTAVTVRIEQQPRGWARLAPFLLRRAARAQADEALAGLARIV